MALSHGHHAVAPPLESTCSNSDSGKNLSESPLHSREQNLALAASQFLRNVTLPQISQTHLAGIL